VNGIFEKKMIRAKDKRGETKQKKGSRNRGSKGLDLSTKKRKGGREKKEPFD